MDRKPAATPRRASDPGGTVLFAPASEVLAHAGRCLVLARALAARGRDVALAGSPRLLGDPAIAGREGLPLYPLEDFTAQAGMRFLRTALARPEAAKLRRCVEQELELLERLRPAAVVCDFRLTMFLSAQLRGIPVVSLVNGRWMVQLAGRPYRAPRTHPWYLACRRVLGERLTDRLLPQAQKAAVAYKVRPLRRLFREHDLEPPRSLWEMLVGDLTLMLDIESLAPTGPLPAGIVRTGPVFWPGAGALPEQLDTADAQGRPLVYATFGSTGHPRLFDAVLEEIGSLPVRLVVSTAGQYRLVQRARCADVRVVDYVAGGELMQRADVVVFHGGSGTAYQAIAAAAPVVVVATHFEQELVGEMLAERGCGVLLTLRQVARGRGALARAVALVLERRVACRRAMAILQAEYRACDPVPEACAAIERFLAERARARRPLARGETSRDTAAEQMLCEPARGERSHA